LAYQPPASSTFLSEQTSHQQPASSTFLSEQISTSHQPPAMCHLHERLPIVTALVAFPSNQSSDQPNEGIKTFPMGFNDQLSGRAQPDN
jgi:hypothetical protein